MTYVDSMLRPDLIETEACYLVKYISGCLLTMGGPYANPQAAMSACGDVGSWIPAGSEYRSDCGRWLIQRAKV